MPDAISTPRPTASTSAPAEPTTSSATGSPLRVGTTEPAAATGAANVAAPPRTTAPGAGDGRGSTAAPQTAEISPAGAAIPPLAGVSLGSTSDHFDAAGQLGLVANLGSAVQGSLPSDSAHSSPVTAQSVAQWASQASALGGGPAELVRPSSLGNAQALTMELLHNLGSSAQGDPARSLPQALANDGSAASAAQLSLAAMAQKTVDHLPASFDPSDPSRFFVYAPNSAAGATRLPMPANAATLATSAETELDVLWPAVAMGGLMAGQGLWERAAASGREALSLAMMALYGREVTALGAHSRPDDILHLANLANSPLDLPVAGQLVAADGTLTGFVVLGSQRSDDGQLTLTLLDVTASLSLGSPMLRTLDASAFVKSLHLLVVPDGASVNGGDTHRDAAFAALGLAGCCLTAQPAVPAKPGSHAASKRGRRGVLQERCLSCAAGRSAAQR